MTELAVAARALEKRFGRAIALRGVDLELRAGACLAVLGPNGAGKSTLLRLMAGLARPSAGSLEIAGLAPGPGARSRIGLIAHATFLYPTLTARENLLFAAKLHSVPDAAARADAALEAEGLEAAADRRVAGFSRGMAQRLAIARGLIHDPEVVLLDEPFTGLDQRAAERLARRVGVLHSEGRTVIIVTHDARQAARLADTAIVLAGGRIVYQANGARLDPEALEHAYLAASDQAASSGP